MNNPVFSANVTSCTGFLEFEMPVYSIEPKCVKRFSEKPVPEQKHRNKAVRGAGFQSQNSSSSFSAPVAFWVSDPLPTAAFV
jgi:hypothetical protein